VHSSIRLLKYNIVRLFSFMLCFRILCAIVEGKKNYLRGKQKNKQPAIITY
jgi:hypothetical protein